MTRRELMRVLAGLPVAAVAVVVCVKASPSRMTITMNREEIRWPGFPSRFRWMGRVGKTEARSLFVDAVLEGRAKLPAGLPKVAWRKLNE